jgi:hypothetical protein
MGRLSLKCQRNRNITAVTNRAKLNHDKNSRIPEANL